MQPARPARVAAERLTETERGLSSGYHVANIAPAAAIITAVATQPNKRAGVPGDVAEKLKALERENRELWQANEILRKASVYFAEGAFDRLFKR